MAPFFRLHDWHDGLKFDRQCGPPKDSGFTWSMWSVPQSFSLTPQYAQQFPNTLFRKAHERSDTLPRSALRIIALRLLLLTFAASGCRSDHRLSMALLPAGFFLVHSLAMAFHLSRFSERQAALTESHLARFLAFQARP